MRKHALLMLLLAALSCGPGKLQTVREEGLGASLTLPDREAEPLVEALGRRDTLRVKDARGQQMYLMKAVRDSKTGEMVAHEELDAAVVQASFRNVAERHGVIDLQFEVRVPEKMQDSQWQLRFYPDMYLSGDSLRLEPVVITGNAYRKRQLQGYERYRRYLEGIITDSTAFLDLKNLEIFLERSVAAGISEQEAVEHYTWHLRKQLNERRKARCGEVFHRYVKVPIAVEGIRLDTVLRQEGGDFVYRYTQRIPAQEGLRKVDIVLGGDIWEEDRRLYTMPRTEPLSFYISSLTSFVDGNPRYLKRIIQRRADVHATCHIAFREGRAAVEPELGNNAAELAQIGARMEELLRSRQFEVDSIVISAFASPEGPARSNERLSRRRAAAVAAYFATAGTTFRSHARGENWETLTRLIGRDSTLDVAEKLRYRKLLDIPQPDRREQQLRQLACYPYLKTKLFPQLRSVHFDFFLHRKGMVRDTVHTLQPDTVYARGVQLLQARQYTQALSLLREYADVNTALAYLALDCNASALAILQQLEKTAKVEYLLALTYARREDPEQAMQHYLNACRMDKTLVFRGRLDPEITALTQNYEIEP